MPPFYFVVVPGPFFGTTETEESCRDNGFPASLENDDQRVFFFRHHGRKAEVISLLAFLGISLYISLKKLFKSLIVSLLK